MLNVGRRNVLAALLVTSAGGLTACDLLKGSTSSGDAADLTTGQVRTLRAALAEAPSHGFAPGAFGGTDLDQRLEKGDGEARVELRKAALAYAAALHGRAIPSRAMDASWGVKRPAYDAEAEFAAAAKAGKLEDWAKALPPATPAYEALRKTYATYRKIAADGGWQPLPEGVLRTGATGPAVAALRTRLALEDPDAVKAGDGDRFDDALAQAVRRAQTRYGQHETGELDADLRAALNIPVDARLAQIRANLERQRWLPRELAPERIEANSAAGLVDVYRGGQSVLHMRAAAGKPGDETPILASKVDRVVLNPTWNVPNGIAENELLPKGAAYLESQGFVAGEAGGTRLVQQPGPDNALGRVKFLFDNPYAVYLHDTPSRAAFAREQRSVSHGCVRLERALDLAQLLLTTGPGWSPERLQEVLASGKTTEVKLERPVQVIIAYGTAFPQADGTTAFRTDVYGWDEKVLRRLDAGATGSA